MKESMFSNHSMIFLLSLCFLSCVVAFPSLGENTYNIHVKIIVIRCVNEIERKGLLDKLLHGFHKPDLSGVEVTLTGFNLPNKRVKITDKNGEVTFEGIPRGNNEILAVKEVLDNGRPAKAVARACLKRGKRIAHLELSTDWVTLKGRTVTIDGAPFEGAIVCLEPLFTGQDSSEQYDNYPSQKTTTGASGFYELHYVKPLSIDMVVGYLINSNAVERSQNFFYGLICAKNLNTTAYIPHQIQMPLISEDILNMARRRLSLKSKEFQYKHKTPYLPESNGNVVFLPDIIIAGDENNPATVEVPTTKQ